MDEGDAEDDYQAAADQPERERLAEHEHAGGHDHDGDQVGDDLARCRRPGAWRRSTALAGGAEGRAAATEDAVVQPEVQVSTGRHDLASVRSGPGPWADTPNAGTPNAGTRIIQYLR